MRLVIRESPEAAAIDGADAVTATVAGRRREALGVATGSSPLPLYAELAARVASGALDLSDTTAIALDEYVGLPVGHPESYAAVLRRTVASPLRIAPDRVLVPSADDDDFARGAARFERSISAAGGVGIQILGLGGNGHLAFNEPGSSLTSKTRVVTLSVETRRANSRFFGGRLADTPLSAMTQGIATILDARRLLVVANGEAKATVVARSIEGPVTEACPASAIQLHPDVTVLLDTAAARELSGATRRRWSVD